LLEQESGKQAAFARLSYKSSFSFGVVSRDRLYDLSVRFYKGSMTNITIKNIVPDGAPIDIQLPVAYRITGNVVDENGKPLKATFNMRSSVNYGPGEFILYPVFPGTHSLTIKVQGYPKVERKVTVYDSNVDLDDIVIKP